ncbi:uncharacterized protein LOC6524412 [Drosophila yakuba]|uniref:BED-type domain-containing protein n=1 Tax=Drosophila yakuba TaxID=7245 RepID=B4Q171_DROYA|nr:uncharacterized protein LOC6524412 [Drosophila yakuba]EDX01378.1 uncharacterized protein Dyak_GE16953 [Drosophila yakuba]
MSKKYTNPVSKHFVYNERTRKSTCKRCHFDMAGRHSENLMRHLKRKHEDTYDSVLDEKRAIRAALAQQQANKNASIPAKKVQASKCPYPATRKKTYISKDDGAQHNAMETKAMVDDEETGNGSGNGNNKSNATDSQFENVFIGKSEIPDEEYQWTNSADLALEAVNVTVATKTTNTTTTTESNAKSTARAPSAAAPNSGGDEDYFLRYLGNKLSKYSTRTRNTVQFHINRILFKADMGRFEDTDSRTDEVDYDSP